MARLHPNLHRQAYDTFGAKAELRVLDILEQGLDGSYDIFHGVDWSTIYRGDQRFGNRRGDRVAKRARVADGGEVGGPRAH